MSEEYENISVVDEDCEYEYQIEEQLEREKRKKFNDMFYDVFNGDS